MNDELTIEQRQALMEYIALLHEVWSKVEERGYVQRQFKMYHNQNAVKRPAIAPTIAQDESYTQKAITDKKSGRTWRTGVGWQ